MKKNRDALRKLMGKHDVTSATVAKILGVTQSSVAQYRSKSGTDIGDVYLDYLRIKLDEIERSL